MQKSRLGFIRACDRDPDRHRSAFMVGPPVHCTQTSESLGRRKSAGIAMQPRISHLLLRPNSKRCEDSTRHHEVIVTLGQHAHRTFVVGRLGGGPWAEEAWPCDRPRCMASPCVQKCRRPDSSLRVPVLARRSKKSKKATDWAQCDPDLPSRVFRGPDRGRLFVLMSSTSPFSASIRLP
jgi:hypothetical protein